MTDDVPDNVAEPDGAEPHVDPMSEIEAEVDAEIPDLDAGLVHLAHRHPPTADPPPPGPVVAPDIIGTAPAPNLRADRQRFLVVYLRVALVAAFVIGVLELILPEDSRDEAATVMVAVFVLAPIGRVVWLMIRWARRGDWRFAVIGAALLGVVATGFLVR